MSGPNPIYRPDTLGRCNNNLNMYTAQHDIRRKDVPISRPSRMDGMESMQQRLNREILSNFLSNNFRLPNEKFVLVGQLGKGMFLAIVLPTYIFFYGAPKWLGQVLLPKMQNGTMSLLSYLRSVSKWISGNAISLGNTFKTPLLLLYAQIQRVHKTVTEALNKARESIKAQLARIASPFIRAGEAVTNAYQRAIKVLDNTVLRHIRAAQSYLQGRAEATKQAIDNVYQPIATWIASKFNKAAEISKEITSWMREKAERVTETAKQWAQQPLQQLNQLLHGMVHFFQQIPKPQTNWGKSQLKAIIERAKIIQEAIVKFAENAATRVQQLAAATVNYVQNVGQYSLQLMQAIQNPILAWGRPHLERFLQAIERFQRMVQSIHRTLEAYRERLARHLKRFAKRLKQIADFGQRGARRFWEEGKKLPARAKRAIKRTIEFIRHTKISFVYLIRLLIAWIWVLFKVGMMLVRERSTALMQQVTKN